MWHPRRAVGHGNLEYNFVTQLFDITRRTAAAWELSDSHKQRARRPGKHTSTGYRNVSSPNPCVRSRGSHIQHAIRTVVLAQSQSKLERRRTPLFPRERLRQSTGRVASMAAQSREHVRTFHAHGKELTVQADDNTADAEMYLGCTVLVPNDLSVSERVLGGFAVLSAREAVSGYTSALPIGHKYIDSFHGRICHPVPTGFRHDPAPLSAMVDFDALVAGIRERSGI